MSDKKQTATQFLEDEFLKLEQIIGVHYVVYELLEKAKEMEKQQIKNAYKSGVDGTMLAEQYYNETYES